MVSAIFWIWPLTAALVSTTYFFLIKAFVNTKKSIILALVVLLELLVIYLYYKSLENVSSGIMYAIINGFSVIMGALIALTVFREKLTALDAFGIALIVIGIVLVGKK